MHHIQPRELQLSFQQWKKIAFSALDLSMTMARMESKCGCLKGVLFEYLKLGGNEISHDLVKAFKAEKGVEGRRILTENHHKVLLTLSKEWQFYGHS